jgi:hypothetical protein
MPPETPDARIGGFTARDILADASRSNAPPVATNVTGADPRIMEQLQLIKRTLGLLQTGVAEVEFMVAQLRETVVRLPADTIVSRAEFERLTSRIACLEKELPGGSQDPIGKSPLLPPSPPPASTSMPSRMSFARPIEREAAPADPIASQQVEANNPMLDQSQFRECWHRLTMTLTGRSDNVLRERIIEETDQTGASSLVRREALARAALRRLDPPPLTPVVIAALRDFLKDYLGNAADLVLPNGGDRFEHRLHEDIAPAPTGIGRTLSEVVFPGAYSGERVLLRAAVRTA